MRTTSFPPGITNSISILVYNSAGFTLPELDYSDDEPETITYGDLDEIEVEARINELINEFKQGYERRLFERRQYHDDCNDSTEYRDFRKKVSEIRARKRESIVISGMYYPDTKQIVIFNKAFTQTNQEEREVAIRMTIAHETFHALHHFLAPETFVQDSFHGNVVKEALADFFSYVYCMDNVSASRDAASMHISKEQLQEYSKKIAKDRYKWWINNLYGSLPYPSAVYCTYCDKCKCFFPDDDSNYLLKPVAKLNEVLKLSIDNMQSAYFKLVPPEFR